MRNFALGKFWRGTMHRRVMQITICRLLVVTTGFAFASSLYASGLERSSPLMLLGAAFAFGAVFGWLCASLCGSHEIALGLFSGVGVVAITYMTWAMLALLTYR